MVVQEHLGGLADRLDWDHRAKTNAQNATHQRPGFGILTASLRRRNRKSPATGARSGGRTAEPPQRKASVQSHRLLRVIAVEATFSGVCPSSPLPCAVFWLEGRQAIAVWDRRSASVSQRHQSRIETSGQIRAWWPCCAPWPRSSHQVRWPSLLHARMLRPSPRPSSSSVRRAR